MTAQMEHDVVMPADDRYDQGYADAWVARGEVQNTADCYIPIATPWRLVNVGDTVVSPAKVVDDIEVVPPRKWTVEHVEPVAHNRIAVAARCGTTKLRAGLDPQDKKAMPPLDQDALVLVLEAAPLATAEAVVRAQFTEARTLARSTA